MVTVRDKVRFVETDMMGVVHHSNYFRWFEMGRVEYLRQAGIALLKLMENGILFPISDVQCRYINPAKFDDIILINAWIVKLTKVKMVFKYRVMREAGNLLLAEGQTQNVFTNQEGKITRLPVSCFEKLSAYMNNCPGQQI